MPTRSIHQPPGGGRSAQYDRDRRVDHDATYNSQWRKLSQLYRLRNPLCVHCLAEGIVCEGVLVDHIIPVALAPELRLVVSNLQTLCSHHHSIKTVAEKTGVGTKHTPAVV